MTALTAERFCEAKGNVQTCGKPTGSRTLRISVRFDVNGALPCRLWTPALVHPDLRWLFELSALRFSDFAKCRIDVVRLIVLIGLACLTWLDPSRSLPGCGVHESRIEALGRMLWGTRYGTSAAARPSVNAFGVPGRQILG